MSNIARSGTRLLAFGVLLLSAPSVLGQAILSDYFSGSNLASISGRTPDGADLPGSTWTATNLNGVGAGYISTGTGNSAPSVFGGQNADFTINISSSGGYTKPAALTLSLDVKLNTIYDDYAANHVPVRGIGLGFFSSTGGGTVEASIPFTGLTVYPDGRLRLVVNGVAQSTTVDASAGFATANFCNLTYSIDTVTGGITSVVFNSNDYTSTFSGVTTAFTPLSSAN